MVLNVVRTYTYDKPGMYNMADVDAIRNKLNTGDWHCSVHVRDLKNGSGSDVCNKHRTDGMRETAIIEVEPKELTFIHTIRRGGGPGESEMGFFPMLPGMGPMTMMAMTNPEALADMRIGLDGMPLMLMGPGSPMMLTGPGVHLYKLSPEMKGKMDEMQKRLKNLKPFNLKPFNQEEMKKLQEQMKNLHGVYNGQSFEAPAGPAGPAAPRAAPAPATPQAPQ
jgi:hypothetical protein